MTVPHPPAALFPDLDLPLQEQEETSEIWAPDIAEETEPAFVPLFQQVPGQSVSAAMAATLAEAREEAFAAGEEAGRRAELTSREAAIAESLLRIADAVAEARWAAAAVAEETAAEMARLVPDLLAVALPSLVDRFAGQDAIAFSKEILPALAGEPRIDIRAAPSVAMELTQQLAAQPTMHVIPDPSLPEGDVRIGWRDGRAEHRSEALRHAVLCMVSGLLAPSGVQYAIPTGT